MSQEPSQVNEQVPEHENHETPEDHNLNETNNNEVEQVLLINDDQQNVQQDQTYNYTDDPQVFLTQQKPEEYIWKSFDFLFPAGKLAKLVKVTDFQSKQFPYSDILLKLKLIDGYPVVNFIGARHNFEAKKEDQRGKFYAGIARACFNTDAIIVDNALTTGIEKFALRRDVKIIGVAPEAGIQFPKLNPTSQQTNELSNGHTHIFLLSLTLKISQLDNIEKNLKWGGECIFKMQLCKNLNQKSNPRLAEGKLSKTQGRPRCKIINILFLDDTECFEEIREAVINKLPIIIVKGSRLCNRYIEQKKIEEQQKIEEQKKLDEQNKDPKNNEDSSPKDVKLKEKKPIETQNQIPKAPYDDTKYLDAEFDDIIKDPDAHVYYLDSLNSEEIAQFVHFFLTYTPY